MRNLYQILFVCFLLLGCQRQQIDRRLVVADSLLENSQTDSATLLLGKLHPNTFNKEEQMYYQLLQTIVAYKNYETTLSDTALNANIAYYMKCHDERKLALSLLYKGLILAENGYFKESVEIFKQVETLAEKNDDLEIKIRVNASLSALNFQTGNYQKALAYSKNALSLAQMANNKRWLGFSFDAVATSYSYLNKMDSLYVYTKKEIPYIQYQPVREQAASYSNVASRLSKVNERDSAYFYYQKSIDTFPLDETYGLLADLLSADGKADAATALWEKAFATKDLYYQIIFGRSYADWLYRKGDKDKAFQKLRQAVELKDSLTVRRQEETVADMQKAYDSRLQKEQFRFYIMMLVAVVVVLCLGLVLLWMYSRYRQQKTKRQLLENEMQLKDYTRQVEKLTAEGKEQTKEVKELNRRIEELRKRQSEMLYKGKERFEEIARGGKATTWRKADFNDYLEYYRTQDFPFVLHLENDYQMLSPSQRFMMALLRQGYEEPVVQEMLGMSDGAFRTAKSRIHSKQLRPFL